MQAAPRRTRRASKAHSLLATTALTLTAGMAAAEISVSGEANMGVKYDASVTSPDKKMRVYNELDFGISGKAVSDNGIEFGASLDMDAGYDSNSTKNEDAYTNKSWDPEAYIKTGGLTLAIGFIAPADDIGGIADPGFDGIGIDQESSAGGTHDVSVKYALGDVTLAASTGAKSGDVALGMEASFGGLGLDVGYNKVKGGATVTGLTAETSLAGATVTVYVENNKPATGKALNGYGISAKYEMGPLTYIGAFSSNGKSGAKEHVGVGIDYALGGGLTLAGGVGQVDKSGKSETVADMGVKFKF